MVSDGTHARGASGKSVQAGTITHGQATDLYRTYSQFGTGTLTYWVWVSSEMNYDWFEFWFDGTRYHQYTPGQYDTHTNDVDYPASNPNTIAVGASTDGAPGSVEERSYCSQFDPQVDVVACSSGGGQGNTTTDRTGTDGYASGDYTSTFGGTSSATPLVSGIVADILERNPNVTAAQGPSDITGCKGQLAPMLTQVKETTTTPQVYTHLIDLFQEYKMPRDIEAVYEDGVLKPLSPLKLKELEKVRLTPEEKESVVRATSGIFTGLDHRTIDEIALSPKFISEES